MDFKRSVRKVKRIRLDHQVVDDSLAGSYRPNVDNNAEVQASSSSLALDNSSTDTPHTSLASSSSTSSNKSVTTSSKKSLRQKLKMLMNMSIGLPWAKEEGPAQFLRTLTQILDEGKDEVKTEPRLDIYQSLRRRAENKINVLSSFSRKLTRPLYKGHFKNVKRLHRDVMKFSFTKCELLETRRNSEEDKALRIVVNKAMSNHLIANQIFAYLPFNDLINCSLTCKTWRDHARRSMRKKTCYIYINDRNPCRKIPKLTTFLNELQSVDPPKRAILPYNGLKIAYNCTYNCQNDDDGQERNSLFTNPNLMILKNLKICGWNMNHRCPSFYLLRHLFSSTQYTQNLSEITIYNKEFSTKRISEILHFVRHHRQEEHPPPPSPFVGEVYLPALKSIILATSPLNDDVEFLKTVIRAARNLEKIEGNVVPSLVDALVARKKCHLVHNFQIDFIDAGVLRNINNFVQEDPKLNTVSLCYQGFDFVRPNLEEKAILKSLMEGSTEHLRNIELSHSHLLNLFTGHPFKSFHKLTQMQLYYRYNYDDDTLGFSSLSKIDWARRFPNLEFIFIAKAMRDPTLNAQFIQNLRRQPLPTTPCPATRLQIHDDSYRGGSVVQLIGRLTPVFSNVVHLCIQDCAYFRDILRSGVLWTAWPLLESLTMTNIKDGVIWQNLDSDVTGIDHVHCETLRETGNYENFEQYRTKSSITNLKKLKLLRLHIIHNGHKCENELESTKDIFLTEVTTKCAFELMEDPDFRVEICRALCFSWSCHLALDCLSPFVTFPPFTFERPPSWNLHNPEITNDCVYC